jgi:2-methylisocitrate lyase-like PEP mutase family enzyme
MDPLDIKAKAETLLKLHDRRKMLVLPNAWDAASARIFAESGFAAIATTSGGICRTFGRPDSEAVGRDQMLSVVRRIAHAVEVPVTADLMAGFGATPADVGDTARAALEVGVVGMNIEDSPGHDAPLREIELQCERIAAARQAADRAGVAFVINARIDTWLRQVSSGQERLELTIARARSYLKAGASCIYPITVSDPDDIAALTRAIDGPVNVMMRAGVPRIAELEKFGVARVTFGSGMMLAALALTKRIAQEIQIKGTCELLNAT